MSFVVADRVGVTFPGRGQPRVALDDVSLTVEPGESVALVGQSGSGKTTLARCVLGLQRVTSGEIRVGGRTWASRSASERRALRHEIQYVPQDALSALDPQQTVLEHLTETLRVLAGLPRDGRRRRALELLEALGLAHRAAALPRELSGGEQRRVVLARVLALAPRLVVADEPTSGLDVDRQDQVLEYLFGHLPTGSGCLMVTHDMRHARRWCARAVVMKEGRVIDEIRFPDGHPSHDWSRRLFDPWSDEPGVP